MLNVLLAHLVSTQRCHSAPRVIFRAKLPTLQAQTSPQHGVSRESTAQDVCSAPWACQPLQKLFCVLLLSQRLLSCESPEQSCHSGPILVPIPHCSCPLSPHVPVLQFAHMQHVLDMTPQPNQGI